MGNTCCISHREPRRREICHWMVLQQSSSPWRRSWSFWKFGVQLQGMRQWPPLEVESSQGVLVADEEIIVAKAWGFLRVFPVQKAWQKPRVERPPENLKTGSKTGRSDRGGCIRVFKFRHARMIHNWGTLKMKQISVYIAVSPLILRHTAHGL